MKKETRELECDGRRRTHEVIVSRISASFGYYFYFPFSVCCCLFCSCLAREVILFAKSHLMFLILFLRTLMRRGNVILGVGIRNVRRREWQHFEKDGKRKITSIILGEKKLLRGMIEQVFVRSYPSFKYEYC